MRLGMIVAALMAATGAVAHDGVIHKTPEEAARHAAQTAAAPAPTSTPFPLDLGGPFKLTDHTGATRTQVDPYGRHQLLFFGYANCQAICSVALPLMGDVTDRLAASGIEVQPVMVTVDPARDTVDTMGPALAAHHPTFVGMTGTEAALSVAYDAFSVEHKVVFEDPEYGPVYAHGSHIYLLDGAGQFLTLLPPILSAERIAQIVTAHAAGS